MHMVAFAWRCASQEGVKEGCNYSQDGISFTTVFFLAAVRLTGYHLLHVVQDEGPASTRLYEL